jgi:hypothetical protein
MENGFGAKSKNAEFCYLLLIKGIETGLFSGKILK